MGVREVLSVEDQRSRDGADAGILILVAPCFRR